MESAKLICARNDGIRVNRKAVEAVLQQYQFALQRDDDDVPEDSTGTSSPSNCGTDTAEFCDLLKSSFECPDFIKKVEDAQALLLHKNMAAEEAGSWDMVSKNDVWGGGNVEFETDDYVLVRREDIMEGIASFMAAYLLSLEQTKDLAPNQLQEVLSKTFSVKKKKGKLKKAWDGSKVIYNVASWGATAIGIYQNPALCNAAAVAFWTSCRAISKLL